MFNRLGKNLEKPQRAIGKIPRPPTSTVQGLTAYFDLFFDDFDYL